MFLYKSDVYSSTLLKDLKTYIKRTVFILVKHINNNLITH